MIKNYLSKLALLVCIISFTSCSSDDSNENQNTGSYFPMAVGNTWQYDSNSSNPQVSDEINIIGTDELNGNIYYEIEGYSYTNFVSSLVPDIGGMGLDQLDIDLSSSLNTTSYVRQTDDGNYYNTSYGEGQIDLESPMYSSSFNYEFNVEEGNFLRDFLNENESYNTENQATLESGDLPESDQVQQATIYADHEIIGKNVTETINGETFNEIIKISNNFQMFTQDDEAVEYSSEIWFAKNIGPIYIKVIDTEGNTVIRSITSYSLN